MMRSQQSVTRKRVFTRPGSYWHLILDSLGSRTVRNKFLLLLHCRQILYCLSHQKSPRILEWVAYPFSRASSWPRNQTGVSCIAGRFSTSWATREALIITALSCILPTKSVGFCDGKSTVFKVVMLYGESDYGKLCQQLVESICNIFPGLCPCCCCCC